MNHPSKKLLILIGGHFALAPRPQKEAAAAKAAGFRVIVRGVWWDKTLASEDLELARSIGVDFAPVVDLSQRGFSSLIVRIKQRLAVELYKRFGVVTSRSFGLAPPEMLNEAIRIGPELTMVHSEAGLWVGNQLMKRGYRVGVDFEDWFSEDLPPQDRVSRPVAAIKALERALLTDANPVTATTLAMAQALAKDSSCRKLPSVIPNCFPWAKITHECPEDAHDRREPDAVSFYWFSQTIGPGRGLELLAKALPGLKGNWELHLRGNLRNYETWYESTFTPEVRDRVTLHGMVPNSELRARSSSHDVGLALEVPSCPSRDLTATNKIFEYLRCGLAVIATDTQGQVEVMEQCLDAGWIVSSIDVSALQSTMQTCLDEPEKLINARLAASHAAAGSWAWENFEPRLQKLLVQGASIA